MNDYFYLKAISLGNNLPTGKMKDFLQMQMDGLTGHIEEAGYPFESPKWGEEYKTTNGHSDWWVYEQTAYWLDGYIRTAILLQDETALSYAKKIIDRVLDNPDTDGYVGDQILKKNIAHWRWAHVVFFRACMALYDWNKDEKIVTVLARHYLESPYSYTEGRDVLNVEPMLWVYEKTGDKRLLDLAEKSYREYNEKCQDDLCDRVALSDKKPYAHGVSYNEYSKLGAILYTHTGKEEYLKASIAAFKKIDETFMLPGGCPCSDEFMISNDYMHSYETCDITDYTWALGYLLSATHDGGYADKIEKCVFNAGLGSVLENFRGLQYFSCANQVIADGHSNHNEYYRGSSWMAYRPNPGTECCPGNVNRFMPNYIARQYYTDGKGIYSVLFGESLLRYDGICIQQSTNYPFQTEIRYDVQAKKAFSLYVRIPEWAKGWTVTGGIKAEKDGNGGFIRCEVQGDCAFGVQFTAETERRYQDNGIWYTRGPLVYSFPVPTRREVDFTDGRGDEEFPAYNMYADGEWSYGIRNQDEAQFFEGENSNWRLEETLPHIEVKASKISNWDYERQTKITWIKSLDLPIETDVLEGEFVFTPRIPENPIAEEDVQTLKLYPYGFCKLRLTVLPIINKK